MRLNGINLERRIILAFAAVVRNLTAYHEQENIHRHGQRRDHHQIVCGLGKSGEPVSNKVLQRSTGSENGRGAVIASWIAGVSDFLAQNNLQWSQVAGVGLAIPGPYERYGVFSRTPNLPASFCGLGCVFRL
jgi:hypothetical protein